MQPSPVNMNFKQGYREIIITEERTSWENHGYTKAIVCHPGAFILSKLSKIWINDHQQCNYSLKWTLQSRGSWSEKLFNSSSTNDNHNY